MSNLFLINIDGTLTKTLSGGKFGKHPEDYRIIQSVDKRIAQYTKLGYKIIGCTNQAAVATRQKSFASCVKEQLYKLGLLPELTAIYFCPDLEGNECWMVTKSRPEQPIHQTWAADLIGTFRKPGTGMLLAAMRQYSKPHSNVIYVGDRTEDIQAAANAGVTFMQAIEWRSRRPS